ncbi:hypothetical protein PAXRUDRAFT_757955 [Paxillus rubicundulus Ve08.2h10]|uniref:Uncharacterized protein n=1 Tax=Paxillus rubicundulus Ve08.2h10 TaxID=930991 RepID=A0A0D0E1P6_9AGAM|nr:hypothetical protein PAXRUDRAFT_757955 [Paxillus rubicundulus Ve08.2h10]
MITHTCSTRDGINTTIGIIGCGVVGQHHHPVLLNQTTIGSSYQRTEIPAVVFKFRTPWNQMRPRVPPRIIQDVRPSAGRLVAMLGTKYGSTYYKFSGPASPKASFCGMTAVNL